MFQSRQTKNKIFDALARRENVIANNTAVTFDNWPNGNPRSMQFVLHKSTIATVQFARDFSIVPTSARLDFCGYPTRLTADRLDIVCNALQLPVRACLRGGEGVFILGGDLKTIVARGAVTLDMGACSFSSNDGSGLFSSFPRSMGYSS